MNSLVTRFIAATSFAFAAIAASVAGAASPEIYEYRVIHPEYGDIGSYTNAVDRQGEATQVTSEIRIAVKLAGITVYRQDATRLESWRGDRMIGFHGLTTINGSRMAVVGEADGDRFIVTSPAGTIVAPANVRPSNPWSPKIFDAESLMLTSNGKVLKAQFSRRDEEVIAGDGRKVKLQRYEILSDTKDTVWLDERGVTVAFRTIEQGSAIDFVLVRESRPNDLRLTENVHQTSAADAIGR